MCGGNMAVVPSRRVLVLVLAVTFAGCDTFVDPASTQNAIVGGNLTTAHPAVVALVTPALECGTVPEVLCTGTLVGPRTVVTAAHCVDVAPAGTLQIHIGTDATDASSGRRVEVIDQIAHPGYVTLAHDIAVLELAEAVPGPFVALHDGVLDNSFLGAQAVMVGFGADDNGVLGFKREGTADITDIGADLFVLTPAPGNSCGGDSGGPVLIDVAGELVLAGVTSFGDPTCTISASNTRVDANRADFLDATIAAIDAAVAPGARSPLVSGMSLCDTVCVGATDCPVGSACVGGRCAWAGQAPGMFDGVCQSASECGSGRCARISAASCECYRACEDCDGGCASAGSGGGGATWLALCAALLLISFRRSRPEA